MKLLLPILAALTLSAPAAGASVIAYSSEAEFLAAIGSADATYLESFQSPYGGPRTYQAFDSGLIVTADQSSDSFRVISDGGEIKLEARVDGSNAHHWTFAAGVNAFGFQIFDAGSGSALAEEVQMTINDGSGPQTFVLSVLAGGQSGYVGFFADAPIQSVLIDAVPINGSNDRYLVDNVKMFAGATPVSTVPLGASGAFLVAGLGAIGALRRKARDAKQTN